MRRFFFPPAQFHQVVYPFWPCWIFGVKQWFYMWKKRVLNRTIFGLVFFLQLGLPMVCNFEMIQPSTSKKIWEVWPQRQGLGLKDACFFGESRFLTPAAFPKDTCFQKNPRDSKIPDVCQSKCTDCLNFFGFCHGKGEHFLEKIKNMASFGSSYELQEKLGHGPWKLHHLYDKKYTSSQWSISHPAMLV